MSFAALLRQEMDNAYKVTENLFRLVEPGRLCWKPPTGSNWMTTGQLMMHCTSACGVAMRAFVTGDWGLPEGKDIAELSPEEILPPAEKLPTVESVEQALGLLSQDHDVAIATLAEVEEEDFLGKRFAAPWGGAEFSLFQHLLHMIWHLDQHKGQLFYYLKLLGKDVKTPDLWGEI